MISELDSRSRGRVWALSKVLVSGRVVVVAIPILLVASCLVTGDERRFRLAIGPTTNSSIETELTIILKGGTALFQVLA